MVAKKRNIFRENLLALVNRRKGETMEKLALETEISRASLYRYLNDERSPSLEVLERLAAHFQIEVHQFLTPGYPFVQEPASVVGEKNHHLSYRVPSGRKNSRKTKTKKA